MPRSIRKPRFQKENHRQILLLASIKLRTPEFERANFGATRVVRDDVIFGEALDIRLVLRTGHINPTCPNLCMHEEGPLIMKTIVSTETQHLPIATSFATQYRRYRQYYVADKLHSGGVGILVMTTSQSPQHARNAKKKKLLNDRFWSHDNSQILDTGFKDWRIIQL